jgi:hypothetical protein
MYLIKIRNAQDIKKSLIKFLKRKKLDKELVKRYIKEYVKPFFGFCVETIKVKNLKASLVLSKIELKTLINLVEIKNLKALIKSTKSLLKDIQNQQSNSIEFLENKHLYLCYDFDTIVDAFCLLIEEERGVDDSFFNLISEFQERDCEDYHDDDFWENKKENLYKKILLDKKSSNSFKEEIQLKLNVLVNKVIIRKRTDSIESDSN